MVNPALVPAPAPKVNLGPPSKCLNPDQMKALANREVQCQKMSTDLIMTQKAYDEAVKNPQAGEWWADPKIVVGGFVITFVATALVTYVIVNETNK